MFCQNGDEILAANEDALAAIETVFIEIGYMDIATGYYDPDADKRNCEIDKNTGYWYLTI